MDIIADIINIIDIAIAVGPLFSLFFVGGILLFARRTMKRVLWYVISKIIKKIYQMDYYKKKFECQRKIAEQGNLDTQYTLGMMYAHGEGVAKNEKEAVKWLRKVAEQGHAQAQNRLGMMYATGQGVTKNDKTAAKWYRKAAEQGYATAQYNLGVKYGSGEGVVRNYQNSYMWALLAKANGNESADEFVEVLEGTLSSTQKIAAQQEATKWQAKIEARTEN